MSLSLTEDDTSFIVFKVNDGRFEDILWKVKFTFNYLSPFFWLPFLVVESITFGVVVNEVLESQNMHFWRSSNRISKERDGLVRVLVRDNILYYAM